MKLQLSLKAGMSKTIVFIAIIMIVGVSTTKAQQPKDSGYDQIDCFKG